MGRVVGVYSESMEGCFVVKRMPASNGEGGHVEPGIKPS